ncbi:hypothetical protein [Streptomyces sp. NPDC001340]
MSTHHGDGMSRLGLVRSLWAEWKPRMVKSVLVLVVVLGVAAEIVEPLGDVLRKQGFLGGSFAALIALILFDAVGESEPREITGAHVLTTLSELNGPFREAFESRHVRIDFCGFTMQTLIELLRAPLERMADEEVHTQELTFRIIIAHLNLPMSLPGSLTPAADDSGHPPGTVHFSDSPDNRRRMREDFTRPKWNDLKELLDGVHARNPRVAISCEVRESPQVPERKSYILNQEQVFYAPYSIRDSRVARHDSSYRILDAAGFGPRYGKARIIGWDRHSKSRSTREIAEHLMEWHRNLWEMLDYIKPEHPVIDDPVWVPVERRPAP